MGPGATVHALIGSRAHQSAHVCRETYFPALNGPTIFAWIDRIVDEHDNASRLLPRLDQAILAKAFRGELVPQDDPKPLTSA
jgi:hypothetical protein